MAAGEAADAVAVGAADAAGAARESLVSEKPARAPRRRRVSVSAEADVAMQSSGEDFVLKSLAKNDGELARLQTAVKHNFLFQSLNDEQRAQVFGAMEEKKVPSGHVIINQGDAGDFFYVLDEGGAEVLVNGTKVHQYSPGSAFGELALMYNCPRAATVRATSPSTLWVLDRLTFRHILYANQSKKKDDYERFLKTCSLFQHLSTQELTRIADVLEEHTFAEGEAVIKEGDDDVASMKFYIVIKGVAVATKPSKDNMMLAHIEPGGFFGEKALIENCARAATVTAKAGAGPLVCASLDVAAFERLLGPCKGAMKDRLASYSKMLDLSPIEVPSGSGLSAVRALTPVGLGSARPSPKPETAKNAQQVQSPAPAKSPAPATDKTSPTQATGKTSPTPATGKTSPTPATGKTSPTPATGKTSPTPATGKTSPKSPK
jgi:cAMP-dependent protein kinase regulator